MKPDIDRMMRRTWRYWYEDGLAEMAGGLIFLAIGLLFLFEAVSSPALWSAGLSSIGLPVVVIAGSWLASRVVGRLKSRLTYPRTGYVRYRRPRRRRAVRVAVSAGVTGALVAFLLAMAPASRAWIPTLQGVLIGTSFFYLGYTADLTRFYILGALSVLVGVAASLVGLGDVPGSAAYFTGVGLALVGSGTCALRAYLRATAPLAEVEEHGQ